MRAVLEAHDACAVSGKRAGGCRGAVGGCVAGEGDIQPRRDKDACSVAGGRKAAVFGSAKKGGKTPPGKDR